MMNLTLYVERMHDKIRRHVKNYRPLTLASIVLLVFLLALVLSYMLLVTLIIRPLATEFFKGRLGSTKIKVSFADPSGKAQFVVGAESTSAFVDRTVDFSSLPMTRPEAELLVSYLKPSDIYLEFGVSGTTLAFPRLVKHTYAIEHREHVCAQLEHLLSNGSHKGLSITQVCVKGPKSSPHEEGDYSTFHEYVNAARDIKRAEKYFDKVLINGPARLACALRILPHLKADSIVFFHDFFLRRNLYDPVLLYYDEVARVMAHGPINVKQADDTFGLLVLKPKKEYISETVEVFEARVNYLYGHPAMQGAQSEPQAKKISSSKYLGRTEDGSLDVIAWRKKLSYETSKMRIMLDLIGLGGLFITYKLVLFIFLKPFIDLLAMGKRGRAAFFSGDIRTGLSGGDYRPTSSRSTIRPSVASAKAD